MLSAMESDPPERAKMGMGRSTWVALLAGLLAGCSGYSPKSNFTMPTFPSFGSLTQSGADDGGKATVMLSAIIEGLSCAESLIVLAQADGDGFKTSQVEKVDSSFGGGAGAAVVELDPGTYHIVQYACRNGAYVVNAGTNPVAEAVPWKADHWPHSLATFAVAGGDVIDAGEIVLTPQTVEGFGAGINGRKARLSVRASGEPALAEIIRVRPEIAPRLKSNLMQIAGSLEQTLAKCRLSARPKPLPKDGSSKIPEILAKHPEAAPAVELVGTATADLDSCLGEANAAAMLLKH